ncbi:MAG TPA: hypothetical protein VGW33_03585 [Terriglobia bacterium]|nr:hypothetical protein [Terriglobia bacterium]
MSTNHHPQDPAIRETAAAGATRAPSRRLPRSTGPRTARGKRRSSLNRMRYGLCPGWVEHELRARGEDPEGFRRLHRDLIGYLGPDEARGRVVVESLAEAWWEKMRRARNWVGAGPCDTTEIDARLDDLLQRFAWGQQRARRKWRYRLESALGKGVSGPAVLRRRLESHVPALGGAPLARRRNRSRNEAQPGLLRDLEEEIATLLSRMYSERRHQPESGAAGETSGQAAEK